MKYAVFDYWSNQPAARNLTYQEAKAFVEQNEPPFNATAGPRYAYWPDCYPAVSNSDHQTPAP